MGHNTDITNALSLAVQKDIEKEQTKKLMDSLTQDIKPCPCCGQNRPFPTQPGKWEYKEYWDRWMKCEIKVSDGTEFSDADKGGLLFYPEYCQADLEDAMRDCDTEEEKAYLKKEWDGPQAWPQKAMWRKLGDKNDNN